MSSSQYIFPAYKYKLSIKQNKTKQNKPSKYKIFKSHIILYRHFINNGILYFLWHLMYYTFNKTFANFFNQFLYVFEKPFEFTHFWPAGITNV